VCDVYRSPSLQAHKYTYTCIDIPIYTFDILHVSIVTANPTWGDIFESSKLKARTSLLPHFSQKRRWSFELSALKQHSKMPTQVGSAVRYTVLNVLQCFVVCCNVFAMIWGASFIAMIKQKFSSELP